jgi:hypothetical protein
MRYSKHTLQTGVPQDREAVALRDHFATIALTQIIANNSQETAERTALQAYQIADSMMRQRERISSGLK